jgi:hypothetical protein
VLSGTQRLNDRPFHPDGCGAQDGLRCRRVNVPPPKTKKTLQSLHIEQNGGTIVYKKMYSAVNFDLAEMGKDFYIVL